MYRLAHAFMRWRGWTFEGVRPTESKFVAIGVPHTCNFDFIAFLGVAHHFGFKASFLAKRALFRWPLGPIMRRLGGVAVHRSAGGQGLVADAVAAFKAASEMVLVIAPEGTRSPSPHWKSGFHRIAEAAGVPIVAGFVDYPSRTAGLGPIIAPGTPLDQMMATLSAFYSDKVGRHPRGMGPVTLAPA